MRAHNISVVICAYTEDRWDQICAAVDRCARRACRAPRSSSSSTTIPRSSSGDGRLPDLTVLENREAQGLSGARNTGAARAQGDIIAFLDDDATAHHDWLKFLADPTRTRKSSEWAA